MKFRVNKPDGTVETVEAGAAQIAEDGTLQFGTTDDKGEFVAGGPSFAVGDFESYAEGPEKPEGTNDDGTIKHPQPGSEPPPPTPEA